MSNSSTTLSPEAREEVHENEKTYTPAEIVQGLHSEDLVERTTYARAARRMLSSSEKISAITLLVTAGIIKPLLDSLNKNVCPDLQHEAAWAIAIITSGTHEHTMAVVDAGAILSLVVLQISSGMVGEKCAWALGHIAAVGPRTRDRVLAYGALDGLLKLLTLSTPTRQLKTALWTYCHFCRYNFRFPPVDFREVEPALPYISDILESTDKEVLEAACVALTHLTEDRPKWCKEAVQMTPQLLPRLVSLLGHKSPAVQMQALKAIHNMHTGSDEQMDRCLDAGCLDHFITLLTCGEPSLIEEAASIVSIIFIGTPAQVQRAIDSGVLRHLLRLLATEDIGFHREVRWAIKHLCIRATPEQLDALISDDFLESFCQLLSTPDHRTALPVVLDGLVNFLRAAEEYGQVDGLCRRLKEIDALHQIEALQQHENEQIREKVRHILNKYFVEQEDPRAQPTQTEEEYQSGTSGNQTKAI